MKNNTGSCLKPYERKISFFKKKFKKEFKKLIKLCVRKIKGLKNFILDHREEIVLMIFYWIIFTILISIKFLLGTFGVLLYTTLLVFAACWYYVDTQKRILPIFLLICAVVEVLLEVFRR